MSHSRELEAVLRQAVEKQRFSAVVVATSEGLVLSSALNGQRSAAEILAAVAPVIRQAAQRSSAHYGLQMPDEAVLQAGKQRMICRFFALEKRPLILIAVVPKGVPYRRTMNRILRDIRQLLQPKESDL